MSGYRRVVWLSSLTCVVLLLCEGMDASAQLKIAPDKTAAHILTIVQNTPDAKIPIESLTGQPGTSTLVRNRQKAYRAYVLCIPAAIAGRSCMARVFFTDERTKQTYMVIGETDGVESNRPVAELRWLNNDRLSYERWMTPHFGHRYVLNVKLKKQVAAYAISDQVN